MKLALISDAWTPQVNGVVRTLKHVQANLEMRGIDVHTITPNDYRTIACPTYPEIRLALGMPRSAGRHVEAANPDYIHIATEGPIGLMTRSYCRKARLPFSTSYHTRFPEYIAAHFPVRKS